MCIFEYHGSSLTADIHSLHWIVSDDNRRHATSTKPDLHVFAGLSCVDEFYHAPLRFGLQSVRGDLVDREDDHVDSEAGASRGRVCKHALIERATASNIPLSACFNEEMCIPWSHRRDRPCPTRAHRRLPLPKSCSADQQKTAPHGRSSGGAFFCIPHTLRSTSQKIQCHATRWPRGTNLSDNAQHQRVGVVGGQVCGERFPLVSAVWPWFY